MRKVVGILLCIALVFSFTTFNIVADDLNFDMGFDDEFNTNTSTLMTAYNNAAALRSANASSTGKNGLRIYNSIKKDWVNNAKIVEFGSIAIRKGNFNGVELTLDTQGVASGVAYRRGSVAMNLWETTADSYIYTAYLTNIGEQYYDDNYVIRAYAKDYKGNVYYGKMVNVSVFQIANSIDKGDSISGSVLEADENAFYAFVKESNREVYYNFCGGDVGTLYTKQYGTQN